MPKAQHPKAASFVRQNLFAGVMTFAELEARVAALPDEQARGDAFEVFAEAYLATQRKHDAANVWPLTAVPTQILQTLGLATKDYGVDGVFKTQLGHFNAYQVKFRTNRPAMTWRELSTFMGLADSPQIRSRVLLTNCDELPSVLNERQGFFCIRGSDLDRLEADDFRAIEAWLADAAFIAPKKQPQPHQTEALDVLLPALEIHDRVSAIMACGTGKTLVALWVAERRQASRILVLVPSLALLRQVLHEWLRESSLPSLAYLCVCSDPTVKDGLDSIATAQSDLDFQVSTDAASVRDFLDEPFTGTKVVFSTYQSARVVGAALKSGEAFDLAVFDEAHKTAGREGHNFAFALEDANLLIRKRLFLTATPRHYNPLRKDQEGDAQLVFSMDRPDVYGPQAYCLTFAEAARRGIICGYKVIISVITSEMVSNELLSRGDVLVNGDAIRARQVANQIALRDAVEKYGASKAFTFHRTVASAASFVADGSEGIRTHLPEFETFHVNGTMPTARREREMRDFRAAVRAVMSNARCLTEGVDVPAVDMVAFLSPRRSRVDIVQATGRAMRRSPGKTTGYVLVPLYVEQAAGETIETAVNRATFDEVWDVLQSLQERDDVLAEIIRDMRKERGRTKGFDDSRFREIVEVCGPSISLEDLRYSISTACVDVLGVSWDERFGELLTYKWEFKNCDVPFRYAKNRQLGIWVVAQRQAKRFRQLNERQVKLLTDIGFDWQPQNLWDEMFERLVAFKQKHDHCNVPQKCKDDPDLGLWVNSQRAFKSAGTFRREDRISKLDAIGFSWFVGGVSWDDSFNQLVAYKRDNGHCNVSSGENLKLARWVHYQRRLKRENELSSEKVMRLDALGFVWVSGRKALIGGSGISAEWLASFDELVRYRKTHGDCDVPAKWCENPQLANWASHQRQSRKSGTLPPERQRRLDEIGFDWRANSRREEWSTRFEQLKIYKVRFGSCKVPANWKENPQLGVWVNSQRQRRRNGKLTSEKERLLREIGFE